MGKMKNQAATFFDVTELTMVANSGPCNRTIRSVPNGVMDFSVELYL